MSLVITPSPEFTALVDRLTGLVAEGAFEALLRRAAAEILLDAYRRRFAQALPKVVDTQRFSKAEDSTRPSPHFRTTSNLTDAARRLSEAQMAGNFEAAERARKDLRDARKAMSRQLERPEGPGGRLGVGNVFRPAVYKLMNILTSAGHMGVIKGQGIGIGPRKTIMRMEIPSATKKLTGMSTTSDMTSLFRMVEFGTGVFGADPEGNDGSLYEYQGGWFYGKSPQQGLGIRGTRPAHVLWRQASAPYSEDMDKLRQFFVQVLTSKLK